MGLFWKKVQYSTRLIINTHYAKIYNNGKEIAYN